MSATDARLERLAEAVVFAHEADVPSPAAGAASDRRDSDAFERTAALAAAAWAEPLAPSPAVVTRLAAAGLAFCAELGAAGRRDAGPRPWPATGVPLRRRGAVLAFVLGAAAASVLLWAASPPPADPSPRERRARALATEVVVRTDWQPGPSELRGDVRGDVVWCPGRQDGWMTLQGLPALPRDRAYQLWIADAERPDELVDGGVFTIADASTEAVVPIRTALRVHTPTAFVITVEDRHGVVVSQQQHVVAIASP